MIRHVSVLMLTPDADVGAIGAALSTLRARLSMRAYAFGPDLRIDDGNATLAVVADFDTLDDYVAYRDDPEHRRIITELIRPVLVQRSAAQYEVAG